MFLSFPVSFINLLAINPVYIQGCIYVYIRFKFPSNQVWLKPILQSKFIPTGFDLIVDTLSSILALSDPKIDPIFVRFPIFDSNSKFHS